MYDKTQTFNSNIVYNLYFDKVVSHPTAKAVGFQLSVTHSIATLAGEKRTGINALYQLSYTGEFQVKNETVYAR